MADSAQPMWREDLKLDAILTDPPYGVRERTIRVGTHKNEINMTEEQRQRHVPEKVNLRQESVGSNLIGVNCRSY